MSTWLNCWQNDFVFWSKTNIMNQSSLAVNATAAYVIPLSNTALTAGAVAGVFLGIFVIILLLCKYKPSYFICLQNSRDERRSSNVGLTHIDEEESENITNVLESDIQVDDDYFYDEVFERSAFTDEATNDSITNLYAIHNKKGDGRPRTSQNFEGHI